MAKAVDLGTAEAAASVTPGGRVKLRFLLSVEQLESLLALARAGGEGAAIEAEALARPRPAALAAPREVAREAPGTVFVREGTPAWKAWLAVKRAAKPGWNVTTERTIDGRRYTGWWFPSLFPPGAEQGGEAAANGGGD